MAFDVVRRPCSNSDMLRRLINCRIIIVVVVVVVVVVAKHEDITHDYCTADIREKCTRNYQNKWHDKITS